MNGTAPQPQANYFHAQQPVAPYGYQPDYGYLGYVPANPPPPPKGGSAGLKILAGLAAVAVAAGGAALWVGHSSTPAAAAASNVQLESVSTAGSSPFMTPVGQDRAGVISPAGTSGEFSGDTPGLFADSADKPSCDAQTLVSNLQGDPAKAAAWADALAINTQDIPEFVGALNPVVLRSDTAVTSHGYENGSFTGYPAVLQAGTAVFVNSFGQPTVKCFSGNPLTRSVDYSQASYVGRHWTHFAPATVTYVRPTPTVINKYVYIDIDHGRSHDEPSFCSEHPHSDVCHPNPDHDRDPKDDQPKQDDQPKKDDPAKQDDEPKQDPAAKQDPAPAATPVTSKGAALCTKNGDGSFFCSNGDTKNPPSEGCTPSGNDTWNCKALPAKTGVDCGIHIEACASTTAGGNIPITHLKITPTSGTGATPATDPATAAVGAGIPAAGEVTADATAKTFAANGTNAADHVGNHAQGTGGTATDTDVQNPVQPKVIKLRHGTADQAQGGTTTDPTKATGATGDAKGAKGTVIATQPAVEKKESSVQKAQTTTGSTGTGTTTRGTTATGTTTTGTTTTGTTTTGGTDTATEAGDN